MRARAHGNTAGELAVAGSRSTRCRRSRASGRLFSPLSATTRCRIIESGAIAVPSRRPVGLQRRPSQGKRPAASLLLCKPAVGAAHARRRSQTPISVSIVSANRETLDRLQAYFAGAGVASRCSDAVRNLDAVAPRSATAAVIFPDDFQGAEIVTLLRDLRRFRPRLAAGPGDRASRNAFVKWFRPTRDLWRPSCFRSHPLGGTSLMPFAHTRTPRRLDVDPRKNANSDTMACRLFDQRCSGRHREVRMLVEQAAAHCDRPLVRTHSSTGPVPTPTAPCGRLTRGDDPVLRPVRDRAFHTAAAPTTEAMAEDPGFGRAVLFDGAWPREKAEPLSFFD